MITTRKIVAAALFSGLACTADPPDVQHDAADESSVPNSRIDASEPVVLFLGTSLTAGLGVSLDQAFPALIQEKFDSAGIMLRVVNAGESGGTSAGGLSRIDLLLASYDVRILVLELGANDGLRGLDVHAMASNLTEIVERTRLANQDAEIVIAGMEAPPNLGDRYTSMFRNTFIQLSQQSSGTLIPFLLEGVGAVPEFNQADGIHPNVEGHRIVARTIWGVLAPVVSRISKN